MGGMGTSIYILDWNGTLNTVADPVRFVTVLKKHGHKVVIWSNTPPTTHPVRHAVDHVFHKEDLGSLINVLRGEWPEAETVVVADNKRANKATWLALALDEALDLGEVLHFLDPRDLNRHLESVRAA